MKKLLLFLLFAIGSRLYAQQLPEVFLPIGHTLHFVSPEPIQYADISSKYLEGDLPLKNVFRIKLRDTSRNFADAIITIAGEKFIAQYHLMLTTQIVPSEVEIKPSDMKPLDIAGIGYSQNQLKRFALDLFSQKPGKRVEKVKEFGMIAKVNHLYSAGDYLFLDLSYHNKTNLKFDVDDFAFRINDKKVAKASNVQSFEIKPVFTLFPVPSFSKNYRNIWVFKKLTFPGSKVFNVELRERQVSGRVISISISYNDVLDADILPL